VEKPAGRVKWSNNRRKKNREGGVMPAYVTMWKAKGEREWGGSNQRVWVYVSASDSNRKGG